MDVWKKKYCSYCEEKYGGWKYTYKEVEEERVKHYLREWTSYHVGAWVHLEPKQYREYRLRVIKCIKKRTPKIFQRWLGDNFE